MAALPGRNLRPGAARGPYDVSGGGADRPGLCHAGFGNAAWQVSHDYTPGNLVAPSHPVPQLFSLLVWYSFHLTH